MIPNINQNINFISFIKYVYLEIHKHQNVRYSSSTVIHNENQK